MDIISPHFAEDFIQRESSQHRLELLVPLYTEDKSEVLFPLSIIEKTIITDFLESWGENMHHKTPDELQAGYSDFHGGGVIFVILCCKGDRILCNSLYPGIGDGDAVGIAPKVFNGVAKAVEGFPDIRTPGSMIEAVPESSPGNRVLQG